MVNSVPNLIRLGSSYQDLLGLCTLLLQEKIFFRQLNDSIVLMCPPQSTQFQQDVFIHGKSSKIKLINKSIDKSNNVEMIFTKLQNMINTKQNNLKYE